MTRAPRFDPHGRNVRIACPECGMTLGRVMDCPGQGEPDIVLASGVRQGIFLIPPRPAVFCPKCKQWRELPNQVRRA